MVRIGGHDLRDELLDDRVVKLCVEERARGMGRAALVLQNSGLRFTDHDLLQGRGLEVEFFTGWQATRLVRRGLYYSVVPRWAFRNRAVATITLECFSEEWPLSLSEERRTYENLRDSDIADKVAGAYRLESDIEPTDPVHEHVAQLGMTDAEFLENRALLYGYDFYVRDGVLHFHQPRLERSDLVLYYGGGETGLLSRFEVVSDPWVKGAAWTKSGIDRTTGAEWEFRTDGSLDPVAQSIRQSGGPGFTLGRDLAWDRTQPRRYVMGEGHEQTEGEARQQVQGFNRAAEWVVCASGNVRGIEQLHARQIVSIVGIGHLSGDYYVTAVTHRIGPGGYDMQFEVVRPGVGRLDDHFNPAGPSSRRIDVTVDSPQEGTAVVGP